MKRSPTESGSLAAAIHPYRCQVQASLKMNAVNKRYFVCFSVSFLTIKNFDSNTLVIVDTFNTSTFIKTD